MIDEANNGQHAYDQVQQAYLTKGYSYRIIFMDLSMPIIDGYEAFDRIITFIRKNNLFQPFIIALTGHSEEQYVLKAQRHNIDEILGKPTTVKAVKQILDEIVIINE